MSDDTSDTTPEPEFVTLHLAPGENIPISASVTDGEEHHKYKFSFVDPRADWTEPGLLEWDGARLGFNDNVPDEWLEAAKEGIETYTRFEVRL